MCVGAIRPGVLAGTACGAVGAALLWLAGSDSIRSLAGLMALLLPLLAGALAAWLRRRSGAVSRAELRRAGAVAGAVAAIWLGLLLLLATFMLLAGGELDQQAATLLAQNGLDPASVGSLNGVVLACAGGFFLVIIPLFAAGLGALAALAFSFLPRTAS